MDLIRLRLLNTNTQKKMNLTMTFLKKKIDAVVSILGRIILRMHLKARLFFVEMSKRKLLFLKVVLFNMFKNLTYFILV
jgi:hypothetical protein